MKIVAIGDVHGWDSWKTVLSQNPEAERIVFIGDYFDSFTLSAEVQINNFIELAKVAEKDKRIVLLIGNHDHHYFSEIGNTGTSGYQSSAAHMIGHAISMYKDLLKMAHAEENVLFTHAGVGEMWLLKQDKDIKVDKPFTAKGIADVVNDLWKYKPKSFIFDGWNGYGDDMGQTPIWIRPRSLMKDSQDMKKVGIIQVVGHTGQKQIDIEGKSTGGKYFFIDTMGTSREYLIIENGVFKTGKYEK